ncbi:MAG TPA: hypothetical protein VME22_11320 [Solirubrobacteraceae bacterium]|nr:hypothetical protein [Solirubrobacteraceae bacterium]
MTAEVLTSIRELDTRLNDGLQVRLLWCKHDGQLWVAVLDTTTGETFKVQVQAGERALDVFHHPYAYAAHHGVRTPTFERADLISSVAA